MIAPRTYIFRRYTVERVLVALGMPLVLPFMALVAIAVRLSSRGPALFRQERPGIEGGTFVIIKFRTMFIDTCNAGRLSTARHDERVTPLGRALRRTHIDELPQLWNVVCGDMSLIGPRPEPVPDARAYEQSVVGYGERRCVRPGLTGWAQIRLGYTDDEAGARKKLELDLHYIRNASLGLDARILAGTVRELLLRRNSR